MKKYILLLILVTAIFSCSKKSPSPEKKDNNTYNGINIEVYKSNDPDRGYSEQKATYANSVNVEIEGDSIFFENTNGSDGKFKINQSNQYNSTIGTHNFITFQFKDDSLIINDYRYGGNGTSYTSVDITFKGRKQ
ncbi:MAG: hypothetical protein J7604_18525 [Sporocytophaga sp.]|uniref:hypothetical protein n=1 Tax=Sporocytophaga sp. TaxID=2231183 RepID=UPI001B22B41F|nr:hypothetical protein [Sporocytophaga sp.]MBO9702211.1 hypothetical protein [Sporocytophaga sp.]